MSVDFNGLKRRRDEDESAASSSFSDHLAKRHAVVLAHRQSPKQHNSSSLISSSHTSESPAFTWALFSNTITPGASDSEDSPGAVEARSSFPQHSSSAVRTLLQGGLSSPCLESSSSCVAILDFEGPMYPGDDSRMTDSVYSSPLAVQCDTTDGQCSRIPTPIRSSFVSPDRYNDLDHMECNQGVVERFKRGRRLPSPISEGETSPNDNNDDLGGMQMEVEISPPSQDSSGRAPSKKCHARSKHSLRNWTSTQEDIAGSMTEVKWNFSMGYKVDCEKCRLRAPGHFSHIIISEER